MAGFQVARFLVATATATSVGTRTRPLTSEEVVDVLNRQYFSYSAEDDSSDIGVVIQMHEAFHFFCKVMGTGCWQGEADCRTSSSLYNHVMMVDPVTEGVVMTMDRTTGVIFNSSMVNSRLAKCAWQYDGDTFSRFNGGCGCIDELCADCDDHRSAYFDLDPATYPSGDVNATGGKLCTAQSASVINCDCQYFTGEQPTRPEDAQCFWKGPAFLQGDNENQIRNMIAQRVKNQGDEQDLLVEWNEIVIDNNVLYEELVRDPALAIPAMLYVVNHTDPSGTEAARKRAKTMASTMAEQYHLETPVPIVGVDPSIKVTKQGPFVADSSTDAVVLV